MQAEQQSERKRQAAIAKVYDKLHEGKLGAHWLWCVIEQIAAGVSEEDVLREFGYYTCAALSHPSTPQGWQTIESAPKDGRDVLLTNGVDVSQGQWIIRPPYIREVRDADGRYIDQDESDGFEGWIDFVGGMLPEPTHWQPLPLPPEQGSSNV